MGEFDNCKRRGKTPEKVSGKLPSRCRGKSIGYLCLVLTKRDECVILAGALGTLTTEEWQEEAELGPNVKETVVQTTEKYYGEFDRGSG